MGLILGLLGGGGSILTVPILVYVLRIEAHEAIILALVLVSCSSFVGTLLQQKYSHVAWKEGLLFVGIGAPFNFLGARLSQSVSGEALLLSFGMVMCLSGIAMLFRRNQNNTEKERSMWPVVLSGAAVGMLAGFLGVGGGFMIVPSLVLFLRVPIKAATGTSLLVITVNSVIALAAHHHAMDPNWMILIELVPPALLATYLGVQAARKMSPQTLRHMFGAFVILLGVLIVTSNLISLDKHREVNAAPPTGPHVARALGSH